MKDLTSHDIRDASCDDACDLAKLIDIAAEGIPSWLWAEKNILKDQTPLDIGIARAQRSSGGFSFTNAIIAQDRGHILGMALSYAIDGPPEVNITKLPAPLVPFVELEALSCGTWFVNALAVYAPSRGQGIGTALLGVVESQALRAGYRDISIQVYGQNTRALRLYQHLGFKPIAQAPVRLHPCQPYYTGDVLLLTRRAR